MSARRELRISDAHLISAAIWNPSDPIHPMRDASVARLPAGAEKNLAIRKELDAPHCRATIR
jgi:hypothetical protein